VIRFGPAGWSYKDWDGLVYPKPKPRGFDPLAFLAEHFDALEVNSTYYHPATAKSAHAWLDRVAQRPAFRFTAKLWKRFTHERGEPWTIGEVRQARTALDVLHAGGRLGALLVQFPWSFRRNDANRDWLDNVLTTFGDLPLVLEVRHASWAAQDYYEELIERGIGFVNIDQPLFKNSIEPSARATSTIGYVRVHGRNYKDWFREKATPVERYDYLYSAAELLPWAERTRELASHPRTEDVYVITNNHFRGKGIVNAMMLQSMVTGRPAQPPETLLREYTAALAPFVERTEPAPVLS
jgi:uncharacterized protein YecE (DUF72 family)